MKRATTTEDQKLRTISFVLTTIAGFGTTAKKLKTNLTRTVRNDGAFSHIAFIDRGGAPSPGNELVDNQWSYSSRRRNRPSPVPGHFFRKKEVGRLSENFLEKNSEKGSVDILDATCGGRSIWHPENKNREDVLYIDKRKEKAGFHGQEGKTYEIDPDEVQDFRDLPYEDESFNLIVFDPPHEVRKNGIKNLSGYVIKKYGALRAETWQSDLEKGFDELWRVLKKGGVLVFKFSDRSIDFRKVLDLAPAAPLFGTMTSKNKDCETRFFVFYKPEGGLK